MKLQNAVDKVYKISIIAGYMLVLLIKLTIIALSNLLINTLELN